MGNHPNPVLDALPLTSRNEIQEQLADILHSAPFRTSRQCQDLFRFIIETSLAGSEDSLRERVIGTEVFGRAADYDTSEDPVVRLRAADVRKRLAQYYQAGSNQPGTWKIEIPTGSYRAQFHRIERPSPPLTSTAQPGQIRTEGGAYGRAPVLSAPKAAPKKRLLLWTVLLVALCVTAILAGMPRARTLFQPKSAFDLFWEPVLANSRPVMVCTGSNRVYILSLQARARYRKRRPVAPDGTPNLEELVPQEELKHFSGDDFVPVRDTYLTIGDASATSQVTSLLTERHHPFDLRFGSDLSFGDLREGSAVLIGAFNNSWTLNMTDNLRFVFDAGDSAEMHVQDRFDPSRSWWPKVSGRKFSEDYAIVSRILDSQTGRVLVTLAGLDHTGTRAAGEFATNPQLIAEFAKQAPKDWNRKNLQIVLHTTVVNDLPGPPAIVAAHYW